MTKYLTSKALSIKHFVWKQWDHPF